MCGITGAYSLSGVEISGNGNVDLSNRLLSRRGPDYAALHHCGKAVLGHSRLKIIDTSDAANQPMTDESGNYTIVFNGEIFNFRELKEYCRKKYSISFTTHSDTEVLLHLLIKEGEQAISQLNGFFAFAFYDQAKHRLLICRDRYGEKPLLWGEQNGMLFFASEMKALEVYLEQKTINHNSLFDYFRLTYIPAPETIYNEVHKLYPGTLLKAENGKTEIKTWYKPVPGNFSGNYNGAKTELQNLLRDAVEKRMISDVPLGCFLSGGIDSTIISGIAREINPGLQTFSIGFPNESFFDETEYALAASRHLGTKHEVFPISTEEMYNHASEVLDYLDEPFADSSAMAVYLLSKKTRQKVTVCLSGDGADELFGGYNKHEALLRAGKKNLQNSAIKLLHPVISSLPGSRENITSNKVRQLKKYSALLKLKPEERYLHLASWAEKEEVEKLLPGKRGKNTVFETTGKDKMNAALLHDLRLVLTNDMLHKVDMMSMANSLEIRPPFLDHRVIDFTLNLPSDFKIEKGNRKKILRDTFADYLPAEIKKRGKKGFEVPVKKWITTKWKNELINELCDPFFIKKQAIFSSAGIEKLKKETEKGTMNESLVWSYIVFQKWWRKRFL